MNVDGTPAGPFDGDSDAKSHVGSVPKAAIASGASFRRSICIGLTAFLAAVLIGVGYFGELGLTGNFHTIVAGEAYRSAQLNPMQIAAIAKKYGIKTIINLRGRDAGRAWYEAEVGETKLLGIAHVDFAISAKRQLTVAEADHLIAIMKKAQKPVLIHCMSGADRSGLASALYLAAIARAGKQAAKDQFSFRFGHISLPFLAAYAMDRTFEKLEPSFGFARS